MKVLFSVHKNSFLFILIGLVFFLPNMQLTAQDILSDSLKQDNSSTNSSKKLKKNTVIQKLTDRVDRFFSNQDTEDELQTSSIRIKPSVELSEGGQVELSLPTHLKFIAGFKIRIDEFNPFALTRFRYDYPLGQWNLRFVQSVFYFADNGFGEKTKN